MSSNEDDSQTPPPIGRQGTMQATAADGVRYLKAQNADALIKVGDRVFYATNALGAGTGRAARGRQR